MADALAINVLTWAGIVGLFSLAMLYVARRSGDYERKKSMLPAVIIVLTIGYLLGWAVSTKNLPAAFATMVSGAIVLRVYYDHLRNRGYVLEDERTVRIEEIASRRTIQVTMLLLAFLMVYLSVAQQERPELEPVFRVVSGILVLLFALHLGFRHYYSRVM